MKFITTKDANDLKLKGIKVELDIVDKNIKGITVTDADGKFFRLTKQQQYSDCLAIEVAAPPETEEKWKVAATLHKGSDVEIPFSKLVESEYQANQLKSDLECKGADDAKVEKVSVPTQRTDVAADDGIPF